MKLKILKATDIVTMIFGEWFDKTYGNTYYDVEIFVNQEHFTVPYQYGYNHGDNQAIREGLASIGYRVRNNKSDPFKPLRSINVSCINKLKRELFK